MLLPSACKKKEEKMFNILDNRLSNKQVIHNIKTIKDSGFTLIELLVVVVLIVIISGIAIPAFLGQREKAEDAAAQTNLATVAHTISRSFSEGATPQINGAVITSVSETGTQTVGLGGATVMNIENRNNWCVEQQGGSGTFKMDPSLEKPTLGECA